MPRGFGRSLSTRLLAIFVLCAALYAYGTILSLQWVYRADDLRGLISGHLSLHVNYVRQDIGTPPSIERARAITESVPVDIRLHGPDVDWASDSRMPRVGDLQFGASKFFSGEPDALLADLEKVDFAVHDGRQYLRLYEGPYSVVVSTKKMSEQVASVPLVPIILFMGLLLVSLTYLAVRWLFMPIADIREGAARIGRGNFRHRIKRTRHDELGDLAGDINQLAADVQGMLDAKRELLLGISHELRTPLSRLKLALEFLKEDQDRESLSLEIREMESIIATLIEAERLHDRHAILHRTEVEPLSLTQQIITEYFSRDESRISLEPSNLNGTVSLDESRIVLLLKNLIGNALRYSPVEGGDIVVSVGKVDGAIEFAVADHGPGFTSEQAEHIGEPFWRGDTSRTRETGGTGLGLYLAKRVAEAHKGVLYLDTNYIDGARLVARLPM